jgi:hypothetical protein
MGSSIFSGFLLVNDRWWGEQRPSPVSINTSGIYRRELTSIESVKRTKIANVTLRVNLTSSANLKLTGT